jgi:predicted dehydrogenase
METSTVYERLGVQSSLFLRHAGWSDPSSARLSGAEGDAAEHASIAAEIDHFVNCVVTRRPPIAGFEQARLALAVVRAAYESAATGQVVRLPTEGPS